MGMYLYKVYGYTSKFSASFTNGNNFPDLLVASLDEENLTKGVYS